MPARVREVTLLEPYCDECSEYEDPGPTTRLEAEAWAAKHDSEHHPEPEEEDA